MNPFNPLFLQASIFVPLIAAFVLIIRKPENENFVRSVALLGFIVPALCSVWLFFEYNVAAITHGGYAFYSNIDTGLNGLGISLKLGLNGISAPLYLLAGIVGLAAGYHAIITKVENISRYLVLLLLMQAGLMGVFASIDIFFFFFFHEFALVPTFIMIGVWGGKGRRTAAMEMTVYLTLGALITLVGLIA
ncbi:MAG: NADH-quinone oxidoreductase subunit N, partial [Verrucomicrobia bacterium CG_4_10_14_0_8_um_filter_43_34]